jgi:hypothetical protein
LPTFSEQAFILALIDLIKYIEQDIFRTSQDQVPVPKTEFTFRARILKLLRDPGIDSKASIPQTYVAVLEFLNNLWGLGTE